MAKVVSVLRLVSLIPNHPLDGRIVRKGMRVGHPEVNGAVFRDGADLVGVHPLAVGVITRDCSHLDLRHHDPRRQPLPRLCGLRQLLLVGQREEVLECLAPFVGGRNDVFAVQGALGRVAKPSQLVGKLVQLVVVKPIA